MTRLPFFALLRLLPLVFLLFAAAPVQAAAPAAVPQDNGAQRYVTIDFNDVDINLFIKYISELTRKNFVVDREVKGKVTIISPTRISEDDAYRVFESVLEVNGFAAVPSGSVIKIVPSVQARSKNVDTLREGDRTSTDDKVVTRIVPLRHGNADEVKTLLTPLISKTSVLISHAASGMLIITDYASNLGRLMEIIKAIDVPSEAEEVAIIPLQFASAEGVAKSIGQLFTATVQKGARQQTVKVVPFERTNALIVFAPKGVMQRVRDLVADLDAEVPRGEGNIRVIYLQHANAEEMVKVLMNLPGDKGGQASGDKGASAAPAGAPAISKDIKIVADLETNSLIITGPREEYEAVEGVIKKLDIPRRMVYLEALIMEVQVNKDFKIGVEWGGSGTYNDETGTLFGGFSGNANEPYGVIRGMSANPAVLPPGFALGVLQKGIEIGGVTFPNLGAVVNAYKNDDDVNVIATPQINQADVVRLEINVEVIKLKGSELTTTPSTFTRTADTTVVVHNEETVVIGGMIGQDTTASNYKVPVLGDVPLLGWLFKSHGDTQRKTNLYIFITPRIVENPAELAALYHKKRDDVEKVHKNPGDVADQFFHPTANPAQSVSLSDIGFAKLQQNDLARAREYFDQALKIDPDNAAALINLGVISEREGKKADAERLYRRVLAREPVKNAAGAVQADPLREVARENLDNLRAGGGSAQ